MSGNALEYAVAKQMADSVGVPIVPISSANKAKEDFMSQTANEQILLMEVAAKGVSYILKIEKPLSVTEDSVVRMQPDNKGREGDPRDIILSLKDKDIGISVKRNNDVMKNSWLQRNNPDFGDMWQLGASVSSAYSAKIKSIFCYVDNAKENGMTRWNQLGQEKNENIYVPILNAFCNEFISLAASCSSASENFVRYMVGNCDYYKLMAYIKSRPHKVIVQGYNFDETMSCAQTPYPKSLLSATVTSDTTLKLSFDGGWEFSMRIHNATANLEDSLKWDVRLKAHPAEVYSHNILL